MTVFQCKLFVKKETLLYSSITTCCNSKGKAQYIKMVVNGWHQLVQLNSTISTQSSPQAKKAAVISIHCATAALMVTTVAAGVVPLVTPTINKQTRGDDQQHISQNERANVRSETAQLTSEFGVGETSLKMEAGHSSVIPLHTVTYLMAILISKINDGEGRVKKFPQLYIPYCVNRKGHKDLSWQIWGNHVSFTCEPKLHKYLLRKMAVHMVILKQLQARRC